MTLKKSLLITSLALFLVIVFGWFAVLAPLFEVRQLSQKLPEAVEGFVSEIYPADLVVTVADGQVSTNKPPPYCLVVDPDSRAGVVFDEGAPGQALFEEPSRYAALCEPVALVGNNFIAYSRGDGGGYQLQKIPTGANFELTQEKIRSFTATQLPRAAQAGRTLYFLLPFVVFPLIFLGVLLKNLWYALVSYYVFRLLKIQPQPTYGEAYSRTLVLSVAYMFLGFVLPATFTKFFGFLFVFSRLPFAATILITLAHFVWVRKSVEPPAAPANTLPDSH